MEKSMLRAFGFVTHVEHPHKFVLSLLNILDLNDLQQEAWNLTNDRCRLFFVELWNVSKCESCCDNASQRAQAPVDTRAASVCPCPATSLAPAETRQRAKQGREADSRVISMQCSLRTTLCVRFKSEVVACGIIFLAARRKQVRRLPLTVYKSEARPVVRIRAAAVLRSRWAAVAPRSHLWCSSAAHRQSQPHQARTSVL